MKPSIRVTIRATPIKVERLSAAINNAKNSINKQLPGIGRSMTMVITKAVKEEVPVRTGRLKNSIKVLERSTNLMGDVGKLSRVVGPIARYTNYVIKGTAPSIGRFVPQFNARISRGFHPGTPANNFVDRARIRVRGEIQTRKGRWQQKMTSAFKLSFYQGGRR